MVNKRKEIKYWSDLARQIISNPRKKRVHPESLKLIEYKIISYPKFNKLEIYMKHEKMNNFIVVTMDTE